jgi:hypothetical protein
VPAGTYHVECDGVVTSSVDMTFALLWRHASGDADTVLVTWSQHFDPSPNNDFNAQAYEVDEQAPAITFAAGDQLVFSYVGANASQADAFIPAGGGVTEGGRDPAITLPQ